MTLHPHCLFAAAAALMLGGTAQAHEFIVMPSTLSATVDEPVAFSVESTHVFVEPEEMEGAEAVSVSLSLGGTVQPVSLRENSAANRLEGEFTVPSADTGYVLAHRHGQVWSLTDGSWAQGGRDEHPNADSSAKYEKFAKALINAGPNDDSHAEPVGHLLEIVPLTNPAEHDVGEELLVQVLYDSKPLPTAVHATFDGFSTSASTYAYYTEGLTGAGELGQARIKTWSPGVWMVRAEHRVKGDGTFDEHVMRAVLLFEVD